MVAKTSNADNLRNVISSSLCTLASCAMDMQARINDVNDVSSPASRDGHWLEHVDKCDMQLDNTSTCVAVDWVVEAATSASSILGKNNLPRCAGGEFEFTLVQFSGN